MAGVPEGMELVRVNLCQHVKDDGTVCGADYTAGSAAKRFHVHPGPWKVVKRERLVMPSRISYQSGYGPNV